MKYLVLVLKGMVYGITHILPGLGGGLVLILLGVYEPFVDALGNLFLRRDRWKEYIPFLAFLGLGMGIAIVGFARLASFLMDNYPAATMFFFMGLMLGTIPSVLRIHADMKPSPKRIFALLAGLLVVVGVRNLERLGIHGALAASPNSLGGFAYTTVSAFFGGCASVTPGLDGSYVLMLTGTYEPIINALSALSDLQFQWGVLLGLAIGAILGVMLWSKAVDTAIKRAPSVTYYVVLGLIGGSLYGLWPRSLAGASIPVMALTFAVGFAVALAFGRTGEQQEVVNPLPSVEKTG